MPGPGALSRLTEAGGLLVAMVRAGIIAPLRPDKYLRIAAVVRREGLSVTSGFAMSARRCPNRPALIDELGTLTYRQLDRRGDALASALQGLPGGTPEVVANYKVPREIVVLDELPRSSTGKIVRRDLLARLDG